ncbi:hypothetical protein Hanom_Chr00s000186g01627671 [Helianthus anomalus]
MNTIPMHSTLFEPFFLFDDSRLLLSPLAAFFLLDDSGLSLSPLAANVPESFSTFFFVLLLLRLFTLLCELSSKFLSVFGSSPFFPSSLAAFSSSFTFSSSCSGSSSSYSSSSSSSSSLSSSYSYSSSSSSSSSSSMLSVIAEENQSFFKVGNRCTYYIN